MQLKKNSIVTINHSYQPKDYHIFGNVVDIDLIYFKIKWSTHLQTKTYTYDLNIFSIPIKIYTDEFVEE